jgi:cytoskeletal protein RodZ
VGAEADAPRAAVPLRVIDAVTPVANERVRPIAKLGEPVAPLVIGEFEPQPAYDPVIGPELAAARTRVGLSVDELAERTRIRPHVIESVEVDDFDPCGGDFYARGHIRTLARVLGKDPAPMLAHFEARYATAPVSARKVFEAELATGMTRTVRGGGLGGPNWALLVGAVLVLILVWSGVRLFAGSSDELLETPPPVLNGSAGIGNVYGQPRTPVEPQPVPTTLTAVNAGTSVEVRDGEGQLVFEGDLVIGEVKRVEVRPPVTVSSDNGGALSVVVGQEDMGFLGEPDQPATKVFQRPSD